MAKNIMIQGTMSNVGKSLLSAALCRVLHQDGYRVAPFKSQNMALNSGVTMDGLEMGRAQILQAQAAGIEPDVRMNPVLLKPTKDAASQVIVNGEVAGSYGARAYFAWKKNLVPKILAAYESLASEYDVIVIEGAGSPAEINLKQDDIVNMGLARMVDAPVLLAADIDPGGVFAQLYGTVELLEEWERRRIKALIINKLRGDETLLQPGIRMLEDLTGIPVAGVLPYLELDLDEEDSMSAELLRRTHGRAVDIALIRLPRISNFTDFGPLTAHPLLGIRYVHRAEEFGTPDLVILPGTKNTLADLRWLKESRLAERITGAAARGTDILGICGGYQMLGEKLTDPRGVEGEGQGVCMEGLGLLPAKTVFSGEKLRRRVRGEVRDGFLAPSRVYGYEIHTGVTRIRSDAGRGRDSAPGENAPAADLELPENVQAAETPSEDPVCVCVRGNVCGTYLHGLFDSGSAVDRLAEHLARKKGLPRPSFRCPDRFARQEEMLDLLADAFRKHMDMQRIMRILERKE